jgi:outer membrane receptor protein involved in Fe transport
VNPSPAANDDYTGGPLLLYLQGAGRTGPATDAAGASTIDNEDIAFFVQDRWQIASNFTLNFGLRWEGQMFAEPTVDPSDTAYGIFLGDPDFTSDGTIPDDLSMWQPRIGFAWDVTKNGRSVIRSSFGIFGARQKHAHAGFRDHYEWCPAANAFRQHRQHQTGVHGCSVMARAADTKCQLLR